MTLPQTPLLAAQARLVAVAERKSLAKSAANAPKVTPAHQLSTSAKARLVSATVRNTYARAVAKANAIAIPAALQTKLAAAKAKLAAATAKLTETKAAANETKVAVKTPTEETASKYI